MPDPSLILGPACFLYATRIDAYLKQKERGNISVPSFFFDTEFRRIYGVVFRTSLCGEAHIYLHNVRFSAVVSVSRYCGRTASQLDAMDFHSLLY